MSKSFVRTIKTKATIQYRGKPREVVVTVDKATGMIALRLHGCKTRRFYNSADLYQPAPPQMSLPL